jgi:hypothetical protein
VVGQLFSTIWVKTDQTAWGFCEKSEIRQSNCLQLNSMLPSLTSKRPEGSEVTSMMTEKFSVPELSALRSELLHGFDSKDAAELLQLFLAGHGYGVSAEEARNAVSKVGMMGGTLEAFQRELESIALVM